MHKTTRFERFLPKIDQQTQPVPSPVEVKQALLLIFRLDLAGSFCFQDQLAGAVADQKIHPPFGDHDPITSKRNLHSALPGEAALAQGDLQRSLVVYLHAMYAQLPLYILAGADYGIGEVAEIIAFTGGGGGHRRVSGKKLEHERTLEREGREKNFGTRMTRKCAKGEKKNNRGGSMLIMQPYPSNSATTSTHNYAS